MILKCAMMHIPDSQSDRDALTIVTALVHKLTVVTRNVKDREVSGVQLINPWEL